MLVDDSYALTLDQLTAEVARLLQANDLSDSHPDNRISAVPDMRTIRYYTSLGLLDRPTIMGRVAQYNRRHVLQLLAIKALQRAARPLSEIQEKLYGLGEAELEAVISASISISSSKGISSKSVFSNKAGVFNKVGVSDRAPSSKEVNTAPSLANSLCPVYWREITIEPGLKILAEQNWNGAIDSSVLEQKIRAAVEALKLTAPERKGRE